MSPKKLTIGIVLAVVILVIIRIILLFMPNHSYNDNYKGVNKPIYPCPLTNHLLCIKAHFYEGFKKDYPPQDFLNSLKNYYYNRSKNNMKYLANNGNLYVVPNSVANYYANCISESVSNTVGEWHSLLLSKRITKSFMNGSAQLRFQSTICYDLALYEKQGDLNPSLNQKTSDFLTKFLNKKYNMQNAPQLTLNFNPNQKN